MGPLFCMASMTRVAADRISYQKQKPWSEREGDRQSPGCLLAAILQEESPSFKTKTFIGW